MFDAKPINASTLDSRIIGHNTSIRNVPNAMLKEHKTVIKISPLGNNNVVEMATDELTKTFFS